MTKLIVATTENLNEKAPLYCVYPNQINPQPAYIEIDPRGESIGLIADYSGEIGNAIPCYVWHNLVHRFDVPAEISGESIEEIFTDADFLACCQKIAAGFDEEWDGSNWVGTWTDAAQESIEELQAIIEKIQKEIEVLDVAEWLFSNCSLVEHWSNQPIEGAVEELESYVEDNQQLVGDTEEALITKAKELVEYEEWSDLTQTHITELLSSDEITTEEAAEWKENQ